MKQSPEEILHPQATGINTLVWIVFLFTALALVSNMKVFGFYLSGWGWFVPLVFSLIRLSGRPSAIRFPVLTWLPWIFVVLIYFLFSSYPSLQRTTQLLTPLCVGFAVSTYNYNETQIDKFIGLLKYLAYLLIIVTVVKTGILTTGQLPAITGLAAEAITVSLLCAFFAASYALGERRNLIWWAVMALIPFIALTRTAMAVSGLTLPLTFAPMQLTKRLTFIIVIAIAGLIVFYMPRVQNKMFYSGSGTMSDIQSADFHDTGRRFMKKAFMSKIRKSPWFGYGPGSGEVYTRIITRGSLAYPHNDWILQLHDYGIFGTSIYGFCILLIVGNAYRKAKQSFGKLQLLFYAGASSFLPLVLIMFTDNIIVYASFFGNLQFTILGLAYGAEAAELRAETDEKTYPKNKLTHS